MVIKWRKLCWFSRISFFPCPLWEIALLPAPLPNSSQDEFKQPPSTGAERDVCQEALGPPSCPRVLSPLPRRFWWILPSHLRGAYRGAWPFVAQSPGLDSQLWLQRHCSTWQSTHLLLLASVVFLGLLDGQIQTEHHLVLGTMSNTVGLGMTVKWQSLPLWGSQPETIIWVQDNNYSTLQ